MTTRAVIWCAVSTKAQVNKTNAGDEDKDDKESLPNQEEAGRELCRRNGWDVVEVLIVSGHSRRYIDIHKCARDMRKGGIVGFDRLLGLLGKQAFDVLIVRDGNRFARTQSLHAYVVESTIIDAEAKIYSFADGMVDEHNMRMFI